MIFNNYVRLDLLNNPSQFFFIRQYLPSLLHFTMDESTEHNNTVFLLQRLQELKIWQKQQEEKLLHDQEFQMAELLQKSAEEDVGLPTDDEDTTIGMVKYEK